MLQRYSNNGGEGNKNGIISEHEHHESQDRAARAPSTAEEFERVAQEKAKQGLKSHTSDKAVDAFEELATIGESSQYEHIKEIYKEPVGEGNSHKAEDVQINMLNNISLVSNLLLILLSFLVELYLTLYE